MKTVVVVGAGCSAGLADLATDVNFLKRYEKEITQSYFLHWVIKKLFGNTNASYGASWKSQRLEVCWNEIDENFNAPKIILKSEEISEAMKQLLKLALSEQTKKLKYYDYYFYRFSGNLSPLRLLFVLAGWELRKIIVEKCSVPLNEQIIENYRKLITKISKLSSELTYISFNYDVLLDQSLDNYYYVGIGSDSGLLHRANRTPIIKPHGSVNWLHTSDRGIVCENKEPIPIENIGFNDSDVFHQHSVIGLVSKKIELQDSDGYEVANYTYNQRILPELVQALRGMEQLVIIGYSFPLADGYIRKSFKKEGVAQNLKKIVLIDNLKEPDEQELLISKIKNLLGKHIEITSFFEGIENWINTEK